MSRYSSGTYVVQNTAKYVGTHPPIYRSSWENSFFYFLDLHPNVIAWASEHIKIPYKNPLTGRTSVYIPDILMVTVDKSGKQNALLIEIKPEKETYLDKARTKKDKYAVAINLAKWKAAMAWANANNMTFRVLTEKELFRNNGK